MNRFGKGTASRGAENLDVQPGFERARLPAAPSVSAPESTTASKPLRSALRPCSDSEKVFDQEQHYGPQARNRICFREIAEKLERRRVERKFRNVPSPPRRHQRAASNWQPIDRFRLQLGAGVRIDFAIQANFFKSWCSPLHKFPPDVHCRRCARMFLKSSRLSRQNQPPPARMRWVFFFVSLWLNSRVHRP